MTNRARRDSGTAGWLLNLQERLRLRSGGGVPRTTPASSDEFDAPYDTGRESGVRPALSAESRTRVTRNRPTLPPRETPTAEELDSAHLVARALELEAIGDLETSLSLLVAVSDTSRRAEAIRIAARIARAMGRVESALELEALVELPEDAAV